MSELRTILVHLDASPRSATRRLLARQLGDSNLAQVTALYASAPTLMSLLIAMSQRVEDMLPALQKLELGGRNQAKTLFDNACATAARPMRWLELRDGLVTSGVAAHALYADQLVLGQHCADDAAVVGVPAEFVPSVVLVSGRAALVVPHIGIQTAPGVEVRIAWKATRESACALTAAIPLLRGARQIHLAIHGQPADEGHRAIEVYLRAHGVSATLQRHASVTDATAGEGLLSLAADVGADLLVMGCYGHSRASEWVLGGASRTILESMTLPVLMAH